MEPFFSLTWRKASAAAQVDASHPMDTPPTVCRMRIAATAGPSGGESTGEQAMVKGGVVGCLDYYSIRYGVFLWTALPAPTWVLPNICMLHSPDAKRRAQRLMHEPTKCHSSNPLPGPTWCETALPSGVCCGRWSSQRHPCSGLGRLGRLGWWPCASRSGCVRRWRSWGGDGTSRRRPTRTSLPTSTPCAARCSIAASSGVRCWPPTRDARRAALT